jgi:hypothetical protein
MKEIIIRDTGGVVITCSVTDVTSTTGLRHVQFQKAVLNDDGTFLTRSSFEYFLDPTEFKTFVNGLKECL